MDKVVNQMTQAWWLTPNEKRAAMSYGADTDTEEMNDYYIPSTFLPLDNQDVVITEEPKSVDIDFSSLFKEEKKEVVKTETKQKTYNDYPQGATNNAKRMLG